MPLEGAMLAIVVLAFMVALFVVATIGYFKNWRGVPEETVVIPPLPVDTE
jgi:hypothetical protein